MRKIVIATIKSTNIERANALKQSLIGKTDIYVFSNKNEVTFNKMLEINPEYIFFPHWSWIIPEEMIEQFNCVIFHTGRLPEDRGGSPIQNQIIRQKYNSQICAVKAVKEIDAGDVYLRKDISLKDGNIDQIIEEISIIIFDEMIPEIIKNSITPQPQIGTPKFYSRRTPEMSDTRGQGVESIQTCYDFIRMLDGEGYPKAYVDLGDNLRIQLSNVKRDNNKLKGTFEIYEK